MLLKVADAHAAHQPELNHMLRVFSIFADELFDHMRAEERELTTLARPVKSGETAPDELGREVRGLAADHTRLLAALEEIEHLTAQFTCPRDACETYRLLMGELQDFDGTLRGVIAREETVIFPQLVNRATSAECVLIAKEAAARA
jgi:regulator of cell morphogenesis and NO signaling